MYICILLTERVLVEQLLEIDHLTAISLRAEVVENEVPFLAKHIARVVAEGFDVEDMAGKFTLPFPVLCMI